MDPDSQFAEEDSRAERIRIVIIGALLAGPALLARVWLGSAIGQFAESAPCREVFGIPGLTVLMYGLFVGLPLLALLLLAPSIGGRGYRTLRDGRFPPRGDKVYRPTRIHHGARAKLYGWLHLAALLPLLLLILWGRSQAEQLLRTQRAEPGHCAATPAD